MDRQETQPRQQIAIVDANFAHAPASGGTRPARHITWNREPGDTPDVCVYTDFLLHHAVASRARRKIAWLLEPPAIRRWPYDFVQTNRHLFDYVLTFDRRLVDDKRVLYYPMGGCWIDEHTGPKTADVSIIASTKGHTDGHRLRGAVIDKHSDRMHVFGRGRARPIADKAEGLAPYRFSLAIENSRLDDYFTEKIIDCAAACTVPIYWGTQNIGHYLNPAGIIQFETLDELETILPALTPERYEAMYPAVLHNQKLARSYYTAEDWIFERYPFLFA